MYNVEYYSQKRWELRDVIRKGVRMIRANGRHTLIITFGISALTLIFLVSGAGAAHPAGTELFHGKEAVAGEALVKFRVATPQDINQAKIEENIDEAEYVGSTQVLRFHSKNKNVDTLIIELSRRANVEYAEPNYIVHIMAIPNDPSFGQLWGLQNTGQPILGVTGKPGADISATSAWDISTGSTANVAAVIDTGIDYTHPDLAANIWSAPTNFTVTIGSSRITCPAGSHGFNAISNTCDPMDDNDHGTHVSGTIGASGNNGLGVVGVNWKASIMGSKFLDASGSGTLANAINAIEFVIQTKAIFGGAANVRVLSNSWGGGGFSQSLLDEINKSNANDMLFVAAAGNSASNNDGAPFYPSNYNAPNVVAVAATDNKDSLASFSNYGTTTVDLGAPGVLVLSTIKDGSYDYFNGTSMATPHVSGAAILILSKCALDTAGLKANILNNVDPISSLTGKTVTGGRLNVNKTIRACSAPAPDFSLSATPSSQKVVQGTSTSYTVSITSYGGFNGSVTLNANGLPANASTSFSPNPATASSTMTVTTSASTPTGSYTLTISGTSGALTHNTTVTVNITAPPQQGLIAYWLFNEGSGTIAIDSSGNGNTGTINGATWTTGKSGSALQFNGVSNYVNAGNGASLNINGNITLMAWIKTNSTAENVITGRGLTGSSDHTWEHDIENGRNTFYWANGYSMGTADSVTGTKLVNDGQWHHVAARANGTRIEVYTDGMYDNGKAKTTKPNSNINLKVLVGNLPGYSLYFNGIIDEIKIYNRTLSAGEIYTEYLNGTVDSVPPTITATNPANNATNIPVAGNITVTFSEGIQNGTNFKSIYLKDSNNIAISTVDSITGNVLTIDPSIDLGYNKTYTVSIPAGAVNDSFGNALANPYSFNFTTSVSSILTRIIVSPSSTSIAPGSTQPFTALPQDQFGNPMTVSISWSSSNTTVGTITQGGLFSASTPGTTTITASNGTVNGTATALVTAVVTSPVGLAAFWNFNENTGTSAFDSSGNTNTGIIYGSTWTAGKSGSALQFNGVSNYVNAGNGASLNINGNITLMAWIKTNSTAENVITGRGLTGSSDHTWEHDVENGHNTFYWANGYSMNTADYVEGTKPVNDGQWHHVAARANATRIEVYTDGMYDNGKVKTTKPNSNTNLKVLIGNLPGYSLYFNGIIDEVKIYNRTLSASEIYAEYLNGTSVP